MKIGQWLEIYESICLDLGISPERDLESSIILSRILGKESDLRLLKPFYGGVFNIVGGGPNLEEGLSLMGEGKVIVADSALPRYLEKHPAPEIVVTDLDGDIDTLMKAHESGSLMVIHAHGDNIPLIERHAPKFSGRAIGTTQNMPIWNVFNFYGFTDGDRAAWLADYLNAGRINLVGFDFEKAGRKPGTDVERKLVKLKWARHILGILAEERGTSLLEGPIIPL